MMAFLAGPMLILSLMVFVLGMIVRVVLYIRGLDAKLERVAYGPQMGRGIPGALTSIVKWLIPGGTQGWRNQPGLTVAFFLLHVGAVLLPLFLLGHTVIVRDLTGIALPSLPMWLADALTVAALAGVLLLCLRRINVAEARALTTWQDWLVLLLTLAPLLTGILARMTPHDTWTLLHLLTGELFLVLAPFTKLSHIVLFFMSRAQIGMDFAIKRGGASRGSAFPW